MSALRTKEVAVAIPAYNEGSTIAALVRQIRALGWDAVVVDDGSSDRTAPEAHGAGAHVVAHHANRGYDAALATACLVAAGRAEVVVTIDGDAQHDVSAVATLVAPILGGHADVAVGSRGHWPRVSERLFARHGARCHGIDDPMCGMKAVRSDLVIAHFRAMAPDTIGSGLAMACERAGARVRNVPITVRARQGRSRFGTGLRAEARILAALARCMTEDLRGARRAPAELSVFGAGATAAGSATEQAEEVGA